MSTTTTKRGSGTKFLALLASLTMMIAGLVGVALAAPASAAVDWKSTQSTCEERGGVWDAEAESCDSSGAQEECESAGDGGTFVWNDTNGTCATGTKGNPNITCEALGLEKAGDGTFSGKTGSWTSEVPILKVIVKGALDNKVITPSDPYAGEVDSSGLVTPNGKNQPDISHIWLCTGKTPVITTDYAYWCDGTTPKSASRTVTDGVPGEWTPTTPPENYKDTAQSCGSTPTGGDPQPQSEPVVAAAVVEEPVAAPVLPATVTEAPTTVAVPAAATLPAAIPAGEGSDTGLPMWALAMIAAGMIGAAFAGKQLLGARK